MKKLLAVLPFFFIFSVFSFSQIVVNTLEDSVKADGKTSLREAIIEANQSQTPQSITFDISAFNDSTKYISINDALPVITNNGLEIKGFKSFITIASATGNDTGFVIKANDVKLSGLSFRNFRYYNYETFQFENTPAILVEEGNGISVNLCRFLHNYFGIIFKSEISDLTVKGSRFEDNDFSLNFVFGLLSSAIEWNSFSNNYHNIYSNSKLTEVSITNNSFVFNNIAVSSIKENNSYKQIDLNFNQHQKPFSMPETIRLKKEEKSKNGQNPFLPELIKSKIEFASLNKNKVGKTESGPSFYGTAVYIDAAEKLNIEKNIFSDLQYGVAIGNSSRGKVAENQSLIPDSVIESFNIKISENKFDAGYYSIVLSKTQSADISENIFNGIFNDAINFSVVKDAIIHNNRSNEFTNNNNGQTAFSFDDISHIDFSGNSFNSWDYVISGNNADDFMISKNDFGRTNNEAVSLSYSRNIKIQENNHEFTYSGFVYTQYCENIDVFKNNIEFSDGGLIWSNYDKNVYVGYNHSDFTDWGLGGWFVHDTLVVSEHNTADYLDCEAIGIEYSQDVEIRNHRIEKSWCEFIYTQYSSKLNFHHNYFDGAEDNILYFRNSGFKLENNIIRNSYTDDLIQININDYDNDFPNAQDSIIIRKNIMSEAEYEGIQINDNGYFSDPTKLKYIEISNNEIHSMGFYNSAIYFYSSNSYSDSLKPVLNISGNNISIAGTAVEIYDYYHSIGDISVTGNNFRQINNYGIRFTNYDSAIVSAPGNFWDNPEGPNDQDSTDDNLKLYNNNPKGIWVSSKVDWTNYSDKPLPLSPMRRLVTSIFPAEFGHNDTVQVLIEGYDFSTVKDVWIGSTKVLILAKSVKTLYLSASNISPGKQDLIIKGLSDSDTLRHVFYIRNETPSVVSLVFPLVQTLNVDTRPEFKWTEAADPEGDNIYYILKVFSDEEMTSLIYSAQTENTHFQHPGYDLGIGNTYFWSVIAADNSGWYDEKIQKGKFNVSVLNSVDDKNKIPVEFSLSQNYPNPFNPQTKIQFGLKESGIVTFKVWNLLGQEIYRQELGQQSAGYKVITFNALKYSSGVYFYGVEVNQNGKMVFNSIKRMTVLK